MALVVSVWPIVFRMRAISSLSSIKKISRASSFKELRSSYRIASIDDEQFLHKKRLSELGFNVGYYDSLDSFEPGEKPQIFLCDILGIDPDSKQDGVWTMNEIRRRHPISPLIAYTFLKPVDARYQEARVISDAIVRKSNEIDDLVSQLDDAISSINKPKSLWKRISNYFQEQGLPTKDISVLEHFFVVSIEKNDPEYFSNKASKVLEGDASVLMRDLTPVIAKTFVSASLKAVSG